MSTETNTIEELANREYKYGFVTDIEADTVPRGLNEEIIRSISAKKHEPAWMLEWRLKAYPPLADDGGARLAECHLSARSTTRTSSTTPRRSNKNRPKSLDEVDPELLKTYEKLGIPLAEQKRLAGVAVDAVFDSVSVATTFKEKLRELGIIFCSFSEAVRSTPIW